MEEVSVKIPKKITPDPIVDSIVEFRFSSELDNSQTLGILIDLFRNDFKKIDVTGIPKELKLQKEFSYLIEIKLSNDSFSIGLGSNVITFSCLKGYKGWETFSNLIYSSIKKVLEKGIVKSIDRIGIRYINFFEGEINISQNMHLSVDFKNKGNYKTNQSTFVTEIEKDGLVHLLRVSDSSMINGKIGGLIDIDTSINQINYADSSELFKRIDEGHIEEKLIFYTLLKESFINKFNPEY